MFLPSHLALCGAALRLSRRHEGFPRQRDRGCRALAGDCSHIPRLRDARYSGNSLAGAFGHRYPDARHHNFNALPLCGRCWEIRADARARLVAARDGGANSCLSSDTCCDYGKRWPVSAGAVEPCHRHVRDGDGGHCHRGWRHRAFRRHRVAHADGRQTNARLLDD